MPNALSDGTQTTVTEAGWSIAVTWTTSHYLPVGAEVVTVSGRPAAAAQCGRLAFADRDGWLMAELGERCPDCKPVAVTSQPGGRLGVAQVTPGG